MVVFWIVYVDLYELRIFVLLVRMMVFIVIVIEVIKEIIIDVFRMIDIYEVVESLNKSNIIYVVNYMLNDSEV